MDIIYESPGPVSEEFLKSDAFITGILGPIGSGKSVSCVMKIIKTAFEQKPGPDGIRRTKWIAARNSYPELKSTTIATWCDWLKPEYFGPIKWDPPITHKIKLANDVELTMIFLAMDRPDDVKKLLSFECTGVWLNEAREFPKAILDGATGRAGRYPSMRDGGCTWAGVIMDTNAPDADHWWPMLAGADVVPDQQKARDLRVEMEKLHQELLKIGAIRPDQELMKFLHQPSGTSPEAENLNNLRPGYYLFSQVGKSQDWIDVYVHGKYGSTADGRPVYPEFNPTLHVSEEPLAGDPNRPLILGWDFGTTPACAVLQLSSKGQLRMLDEVVGDNIVLSQFIDNQVQPFLNMRYPGYKVISLIDPAGTARAQSVGTSCRDVLRAKNFNPSVAYTNDFTPRREAVVQYLTKLVEGQPGFLMSPTCRVARAGMSGKYQFKRVLVPGEERYKDEPDKNKVSHICEAIQYGSMFVGRPFRPNKPGNQARAKKYKPASRAGY